MQKVTLYIFGMECAGCVAAAKMALEDIAGVKHAAVSLEECAAVVEYEAPATVEQMEAAIAEAGFKVEK